MSIETELLCIFLDEAADNLERFERICLDLEASTDSSLFDALFRVAHNLKGAARTVNLHDFGEFVHGLEDLLQLLSRNALKLEAEVLTVLLDAQGVMSQWILSLRSDPTANPERSSISNRIELLCELGREAPQHDRRAYSKHAGATPDVAVPAGTPELPAVKAREPHPVLPPNLSGETVPPQHTHTRGASAPRMDDETIRISSSKLDQLIQLIGELSIHHGIVHEARKVGELDSRTSHHALHLSYKITKELHTKALTLRMLPVQALFQKLERSTRDLARSQGKKVRVVCEGSNVELDKGVIEQIAEPLLHIVRNAVDHGIEEGEARLCCGKADCATLQLSAVQDTAGVRLTIEDDGRGLNVAKIRERAIERRLISPDANLSNGEIYQLIFLPGFSTSDQVTEISGRGVGMDVVMNAVLALHGQISVKSQEGQGTAISIILPTSLSIVDALVVKVNENRYAIPMQELTEIIDLDSHTIEHSGNRGMMICLRGDVIPLEKLADYMSLAQTRTMTSQHHEENHSCPALLVHENNRPIAFRVDSIVSQQQIVIRPLSEQLLGLPGLSGCTILGNGEPGMIISLPEVARHYFKTTDQGGH